MLFVSCKKDEETIPNVSVNIVISTTDPSYNDLNAVGGWIYLTGGSRGIIIYRYSIDEFMAFDRHCTYEPTESCAVVEVDLSGIIAEDLCCGSQFLLTDGSVIDGPASVPLKFYQTTFDGNNLYVYNQNKTLRSYALYCLQNTGQVFNTCNNLAYMDLAQER